VLEALINACRAYLKHALAGHSMSAKAKQKSMKTLLSNDFGVCSLKSLKKKTTKKLSTACSFRHSAT
jgi:hypothetical protein